MSYSHDYQGLFGLGQDKSYSPAEISAAARQAVSVVTSISADQLRSPVTAVRTFQNMYGHGLTVDGLYGPATRAALATVTGQQNLPQPPARASTVSVPTSTSAPSTTSSALPSDLIDGSSGPPSWLVPVAVVGTVVVVAGVVMMRKRKRAPVTANKRRRRRAH